jgi:hypothetical protein
MPKAQTTRTQDASFGPVLVIVAHRNSPSAFKT